MWELNTVTLSDMKSIKDSACGCDVMQWAVGRADGSFDFKIPNGNVQPVSQQLLPMGLAIFDMPKRSLYVVSDRFWVTSALSPLSLSPSLSFSHTVCMPKITSLCAKISPPLSLSPSFFMFSLSRTLFMHTPSLHK